MYPCSADGDCCVVVTILTIKSQHQIAAMIEHRKASNLQWFPLSTCSSLFCRTTKPRCADAVLLEEHKKWPLASGTMSPAIGIATGLLSSINRLSKTLMICKTLTVLEQTRNLTNKLTERNKISHKQTKIQKDELVTKRKGKTTNYKELRRVYRNVLGNTDTNTDSITGGK